MITNRMSIADWKRVAATKPAKSKSEKAHKYGATRTKVDGIWFDSASEAERYRDLKLLERAGKITELELQPSFALHTTRPEDPEQRIKMCDYVADFRYVENGQSIVEDVKGSKDMQTPMSKLKIKWVEAEHGITVSLVDGKGRAI